MTTTAPARNVALEKLAELLHDQQARKLDFVVPASKMSFTEGVLEVDGTEPEIGDEGVTLTAGRYEPTDVFLEGIADKLSIPVGYVKRMSADRPDIFDTTVNGWLGGRRPKYRYNGGTPELVRDGIPADKRSFLIRAFSGGSTGTGVARAFLSDRYEVIDNFDALTACLQGVEEAGVEVNISGCDLSDRRMRVRVECPGVRALAPALLSGYRSPFTGESGDENPTVWSGFVISNSETGDGAFTVTPRLVVEVCRNGMTMTKDAVRGVHLGARKDEGTISWSQDTQRKVLEVLTAKTRDVVKMILDPAYVEARIKDMEDEAGREIDDPNAVIQTVSQRLKYSEEQRSSILSHFIKGGQMTAGGVMHAITAASQEVDDPDVAAEVEESALAALSIAASL